MALSLYFYIIRTPISDLPPQSNECFSYRPSSQFEYFIYRHKNFPILVQSRPRRRTCGIPLHASYSASAAPQNQLHSANCTRRKICCGVLRCATLAWHLKSLYPVLKYGACLKLLCIKAYKSFSIFSTGSIFGQTFLKFD